MVGSAKSRGTLRGVGLMRAAVAECGVSAALDTCIDARQTEKNEKALRPPPSALGPLPRRPPSAAAHPSSTPAHHQEQRKAAPVIEARRRPPRHPGFLDTAGGGAQGRASGTSGGSVPGGFA
ncbi:unnamed protein product [Cutaneotrichosporon oleaginosum]